MRYITVEAANSTELDEKVNKLLNNGWTLYGTPQHMENCSYQTLIETSDDVKILVDKLKEVFGGGGRHTVIDDKSVN